MKDKIIIAILLQLACCFKLIAVPANSAPAKITQPDGSQLTVQLIGDEFFHYYQTTDGLVIQRNSAGIFEYLNLLSNDSIVLSGIKVNEITDRKAKEIAFVEGVRNKKIKSVMYEKSLSRSDSLQEDETQPLRSTTGTKKILCILIGFQDVPFSKTQAEFHNLLNQTGYNGTGSVRDFYLENSYGQFTLDVTVAGI